MTSDITMDIFRFKNIQFNFVLYMISNLKGKIFKLHKFVSLLIELCVSNHYEMQILKKIASTSLITCY